jgi:hypothetical protein
VSVFENMTFPEYEFHEYPKRVYPEGGPKDGIRVHNEIEEKAAMGGVAPVGEEEERAKLIAAADLLGVKVDKRWGSEKLKAAFEAKGIALPGAQAEPPESVN